MKLDHLGVIHFIDMIARQDKRIAGRGFFDGVDVLIDGVGGPLIPMFGDPLLRRDDFDVFVEFAAEKSPALVDVPTQADRLVLGEDEDFAQVGVEAIGQGEVDDSINSAEGDRRLGTIAGQGFESGPSTAGQNDA